MDLATCLGSPSKRNSWIWQVHWLSRCDQYFYARLVIIYLWASALRGRIAELNAKSLNLALFLFVAITLTNAALVDYRSAAMSPAAQRSAGNTSIANYERISSPTLMTYLQARKYAGFETQSTEFAPSRSSWRGATKSLWVEAGLCCQVFELIIQMKGGKTRIQLLRAIEANPSNKLQLAENIGIDWKAIDRHVNRLLEFSLVKSYVTVGTSTVYCVTDKGRKVLSLIDSYHKNAVPDEKTHLSGHPSTDCKDNT